MLAKAAFIVEILKKSLISVSVVVSHIDVLFVGEEVLAHVAVERPGRARVDLKRVMSEDIVKSVVFPIL